MSILHYIITPKPLDFSKLNHFASSIENAEFDRRGDSIYFYWITGKSARGLDVSIDGDNIEIRNTILSNRHDYELTDKIIAEIIRLTDGVILNEEEEPIVSFPVYQTERIKELQLHHCQLIQGLIKAGKDEISIFCPVRKVHFGKKLFQSFKDLEGVNLTRFIFDLIHKVNYQLPDYEEGSLMQISDGEKEKKIVKLLTHNTDTIIDKYDYIMLDNGSNQPILITNDILNTMLPSNWTLEDEYTVVAPITSETEWAKLLNRAVQQNLFNNFIKR